MKNLGLDRNIPMLREAREAKPGFRPGIEILIFLGLFFVCSTAESIPAVFGALGAIFSNPDFLPQATALVANGDIAGYVKLITDAMMNMPGWFTILSLFSTVLAIIVCILFCRVIQKRRMPSMGFRRGHIVREYAVGAAVGVAMISATVLICMALGGGRLKLEKPNVGLLLLFLCGYFFQGMSEEVLCRGCLMVSLARRNKLWVAVLTSSLMFSMLHIFNPGFGPISFVNILLTGGIFAVYMLKRGNIWGAAAMHTFWNFFQGNIFGISVSGTGGSDAVSLLSFDTSSGLDLLTGGRFGIENSLCCTAVMLAAFLLVLFVMKPAKGLIPEETEVLSAPAAL